MTGSLSLALRVLGTIEIGAVTLRVASVPSRLPSFFTVRLSIVAMMNAPSVARGRSPMAPKKSPVADVTGALAEGNPLAGLTERSEEHTSELQSLMRISYAVFCLKKIKSIIRISLFYYY